MNILIFLFYWRIMLKKMLSGKKNRKKIHDFLVSKTLKIQYFFFLSLLWFFIRAVILKNDKRVFTYQVFSEKNRCEDLASKMVSQLLGKNGGESEEAENMWDALRAVSSNEVLITRLTSANHNAWRKIINTHTQNFDVIIYKA